jgi:hypothetical protein
MRSRDELGELGKFRVSSEGDTDESRTIPYVRRERRTE